LKIYFDYPLIRKPWGGGAHFLVFFSEFLAEKGHEIIFKLKGDIDLIFLSNNTQEMEKKIRELYRLIDQSISQENKNIADVKRENNEYYKGKLAILEAIKAYMEINNIIDKRV